MLFSYTVTRVPFEFRCKLGAPYDMMACRAIIIQPSDLLRNVYETALEQLRAEILTFTEKPKPKHSHILYLKDAADALKLHLVMQRHKVILDECGRELVARWPKTIQEAEATLPSEMLAQMPDSIRQLPEPKLEWMFGVGEDNPPGLPQFPCSDEDYEAIRAEFRANLPAEWSI